MDIQYYIFKTYINNIYICYTNISYIPLPTYCLKKGRSMDPSLSPIPNDGFIRGCEILRWAIGKMRFLVSNWG
jgi:hypothetical protein